jgi:hypothetical protein
MLGYIDVYVEPLKAKSRSINAQNLRRLINLAETHFELDQGAVSEDSSRIAD